MSIWWVTYRIDGEIHTAFITAKTALLASDAVHEMLSLINCGNKGVGDVTWVGYAED